MQFNKQNSRKNYRESLPRRALYIAVSINILRRILKYNYNFFLFKEQSTKVDYVDNAARIVKKK